MFRRIMDQKGGWLALSLLAVALFVLVNVAASRFVGLRADLTEDRLYSLSEGTRNIVRKLEKPVELTLYYSDALGTNAPVYGNYALRVKDMLRVIETTGGGKVTLAVKDPKPFSEVEDKAVALGMQGVPVDETGAKVYFGLAAKSGEKEIVIPFFQLERERFLEYDIASLIFNLGSKGKPVLGVYSTRPMFGDFQMQMRGLPATPWAVIQQLQNYVDVKQMFDLEDIWKIKPDVLMIAQPGGLEAQDYYDIDQYLLRGGKAIVFLDPFNETAAGRRNSQFPERVTSDMQRLLDHWGVEMVKDRVAGDRRYARMVNAGDDKRVVPAPFLTWMSVRGESFSQSDVVTSQISLLNLQSAGILQQKEGSPLKFEPLVTSSPDSQEIDVKLLDGEKPNILGMLDGFQPSGKRLVLAARLSGRTKSMFPDGPPKEEEKKDEGAKKDEKPDAPAGKAKPETKPENKPEVKADKAVRAKSPADVAQAPAEKPDQPQPPDEGGKSPAAQPDAPTDAPAAAEKKEEEKPVAPPHIAESTAPMNVILVADTDFLEDRFWVQTREFFGQRVQVPFANNADFVVNAVENLAGGDDLTGLRSRGTAQRPFTKIAELKLNADQHFRAEEQRLRKKLEEAEKNLAELDKKKADGASDATVDKAVQATAAKFTEEVVSTRKALRQVQLALREDIESLETWLRFVNIALIPILVGVLAVALGIWRVRRRKKRADLPAS
ncbi:MAG: hypothetical protein GEU87_00475 [Alphaproteobacteria bacterium]|nr:hypothetical protein [Alphaproteobacteria bacterium]